MDITVWGESFNYGIWGMILVICAMGGITAGLGFSNQLPFMLAGGIALTMAGIFTYIDSTTNQTETATQILKEKYGAEVIDTTSSNAPVWGPDETITTRLALPDDTIKTCTITTFPNPQDTLVACGDTPKPLDTLNTWNPQTVGK